MLLHEDTQGGQPPVPSRAAVNAELLMYELHALRYPDVHPAWVYVEPNEVTGPQGHLAPSEAYDLFSAQTTRDKASILFPHFKAVGRVVLQDSDRLDLAGDFSLLCATSAKFDPGFHELLALHRKASNDEKATVVTMLLDTLPPAEVVNGILDEVEKAKRVSSVLMKYLANLS